MSSGMKSCGLSVSYHIIRTENDPFIGTYLQVTHVSVHLFVKQLFFYTLIQHDDKL